MAKQSSEVFKELFKFADEYDLQVLLDKPFKEMPQLVLIIKKGNVVLGQQVLEDIYELEEKSGTLLNELSKNAS